MNKFFDNVLAVLKQDTRFFTEDGTFLRNAVYEAAMQMDPNLIHLLLQNEQTKSRFFKKVDDVYVFDKIGFGWVINNREFLPDSYTRFKNKIGLVDETGNFISQSGKVDLVFPFKDCVLEGGQTTEEQKRNETFFNEILAPDEIDRLLAPKVFTKAEKYSPQGKETANKIGKKENLIIRGNNLLVLASLLRKYSGCINCICIAIWSLSGQRPLSPVSYTSPLTWNLNRAS